MQAGGRLDTRAAGSRHLWSKIGPVIRRTGDRLRVRRLLVNRADHVARCYHPARLGGATGDMAARHPPSAAETVGSVLPNSR